MTEKRAAYTIVKNRLDDVLADRQEMDEIRLRIQRAMDQLDAAGIWPGVGVESWEGPYLRLVFGKVRRGTGERYQGPDGKRKLYIGSDPEAIRQARLKNARRRRWEILKGVASEVDETMHQVDDQIEHIARWAHAWKQKIVFGHRHWLDATMQEMTLIPEEGRRGQ